MDKLQLDCLTVSGTPRQMGHAHGEHFRDRIHNFVAMRVEAVQGYARDRGLQTVDGLMDIGRQSHAMQSEWDPEGFEEHQGIAEGAGIDPVTLYTITNMTDMRDALILKGQASELPADAEGCTSILVPGSHTSDGQAVVGQTWDLNPPDVAHVVAIHRRPLEGPRTWSVTCTGCLTLVGMNEWGLAVGTTNIKAWGSRPGVGYLTILHRVVRAPDAKTAAQWVAESPRGGAHTYWLADKDTQIELEVSADRADRRDTSAGPIWRSNHCLSAAHRAIQGEPTSESSQSRFDRVGELLAQGPSSVAGLQAIFADRSRGVFSINRYAEDAQGTATNAVFVAVPSEGRAWACRGPADRGAWVSLDFTG